MTLGSNNTATPARSGLNPEQLLSGRASGVLLHLSCLPSAHGIGDMGAAAYEFADQLQAAGQKYWQMLPLNPSNPQSGESPYFSSSAFAGNPLLIDLRQLLQQGLLQGAEIEVPADLPPTQVAFARVRKFKLAMLELAAARFLAAAELQPDFHSFCARESAWLDDFSLFTALQQQQQAASWADWPAPLRQRDPAALEQARQQLAEPIRVQKVLQYFFDCQWTRLKSYCNSLGLVVFGDMPIYVSYESADVWANAELFKLDQNQRPVAVSGVPPDYFSATGQLWNNPVYNWERLQATNYQWWIERMGGLFQRFDIVRIDHFRGLVQYWEVPAGEPTAINGSWQDVPAYEFFDCLKAAYPHFPVVVEDLGIITPDVVEVKDHYQLPGMLILQFAFSDNDDNPYLPDKHPQAALVYLGTHDNTTGRAWYEQADPQTRASLLRFIDANEGDDIDTIVDQLLALTLSSRADIAIVTAQDLLVLGADARINDPAVNTGNWGWRMTQAEFERLPMARLAELTRQYGRVWQANQP
ncbi:MAG: 4-alpha-glucanotransferase [Gammaproteobacteria bacterium]|nr:4-alpha-glucanotransferase [Gammaproteobacteria bacterium]